jgi:hypothetical protein
MQINYDLVCVHWLDAQSSCDWKDIEDRGDQQLALCISVGYLVFRSEESITLATDFASSDRSTIDQFGNSISIPQDCIEKIIEIEY